MSEHLSGSVDECWCVCVWEQAKEGQKEGERDLDAFRVKWVGGKERLPWEGREGDGGRSPFAEMNWRGLMDTSDGVICLMGMRQLIRWLRSNDTTWNLQRNSYQILRCHCFQKHLDRCSKVTGKKCANLAKQHPIRTRHNGLVRAEIDISQPRTMS